jgi:hypothetical protein
MRILKKYSVIIFHGLRTQDWIQWRGSYQQKPASGPYMSIIQLPC